MDRRELLNLGSMAAVAGVAASLTESASAAILELDGRASLLHIYTDESGTHAEELKIAKQVDPIPGAQMIVRGEGGATPAWHNTPAPQFAVAITGELEVELEGGARRRIRTGDLVFLEDTKGKGHVTYQNGHVTNVFIRVPPNFDIRAWARGKA